MLSSIARGNSGLLLEKRRGDRNQQGLVSCHAYQHETDQSLFSRLTSLIYTHCSNDLIQKSDKLYAENRGKHGNYGVCFFLEGVNALNFCRRRVRKVLGMLAAFLCLALASCATVTPSVASPEVPVEVPQSDDKPVVEEQEFPVEIVPPEIEAAEEKPVPQAEAEPLVFPGSTLLGTLPYEPESTEEEIITVSMWESGEREERLERAFDLYESLHPGVSIDAEFIDYNGYWGNIALDAGSGRLSDIIEMDRTHLRTFEQRSLIKDISEYFDGISGYGLPLGLVSDVMLYDEALVDESGTVVSNPLTMDNLVDVGERIYEEKGIKTAVSLKMDFLESLAAADGRDIYEEIAEGRKDTVLKYFRFLSSLSDYGFFSFSGSGCWNSFTDTTELEHGEGYSAVPFSRLEPYALLSITSEASENKSIGQFLSWLLLSEEAGKILRLDFGVPAFRDISEEHFTGDEKEQLSFISSVDFIPYGSLPPIGSPEVARILLDYSSKVRSGMLDASEATSLFIHDSRIILERAGAI